MNKVLQCETVFFADVSEENDFNFSNIKMYSTSSHKQHLGTTTDICSTMCILPACILDLESVDSRISHSRYI